MGRGRKGVLIQSSKKDDKKKKVYSRQRQSSFYCWEKTPL